MTTAPSFRSVRNGTVTHEEALALAATFRIKPLPGVIRGVLGELADYDGDFLVHDGDLSIDGDCNVAKLGAVVLVVLGDLTVTGCYRDTDDPQTITQVTGTLRARDVVTAGFLEVHRDVVVGGAFLGDYNDCNGYVGGDLRCALFFPEEHFLHVEGELAATVAFGNVKHRVSGPGKRPEAIPMDDPRLLEHFDRELLTVEEHDDEPPQRRRLQEVRRRPQARIRRTAAEDGVSPHGD